MDIEQKSKITVFSNEINDEFKTYKQHLEDEIESIKEFFSYIFKFTRKYRCFKRKFKFLVYFKNIFFSKITTPYNYLIFNFILISIIWLSIKLFSYDDVRAAVKAQNLKYSIACENYINDSTDYVSNYNYHQYFIDTYISHYNSKLNHNLKTCNCKLVGHCLSQDVPDDFLIYTTDLELSQFEQFYMHPIQIGGYWKPPDCIPDYYYSKSININKFQNNIDKMTFIVIPYLNRYENLRQLLYNLHPFLQRQYINYRIIVVEQDNAEQSFNKGRLYNSAFYFLKTIYSNDDKKFINFNKYINFDLIKNDMLSVHNGRVVEFNCMILHDVDLLPENDYNIYECDKYTPRHLSLSIRHNDDLGYYKNLYELLVGGVLTLKPFMYEKINGFSNEYWKWGAEDDDLALRMIAKDMCIKRPSEKVSLYKMSSHKPSQKNPIRGNLLFSTVSRMAHDGLKNLNNLGVEIVDVKFYNFFTHIKVDVREPDSNYMSKYL